jgi:hypothetical protein
LVGPNGTGFGIGRASACPGSQAGFGARRIVLDWLDGLPVKSGFLGTLRDAKEPGSQAAPTITDWPDTWVRPILQL